MGVSQWFEDRRPDAVSHGILGRTVYTAIVVLVAVAIFARTGAGVLALVVVGFAMLFAGIPFLVKTWSRSASAKKRDIAHRLRIDPEPPPRDLKARSAGRTQP